MKRSIHQFISFILIACILCTTVIPAFADNDNNDTITPRASLYIASVKAYVEAGSTTGSLNIRFNITGNGKMTSLGAMKIQVYDANGTCVKTFNYYDTSGMMGSNQFAYASYVTYTGAKSGAYYHAVVKFKASNSTGGDSCIFTTKSAAAK